MIIPKPINHEMKTYFFQAIDTRLTRTFLAHTNKPFSLNILFSPSRQESYLCLDTRIQQQAFRSTTFPLVFPIQPSKDVDGYVILPRKALCFPFAQDGTRDIWKDLQAINKINGTVYLQLLLHKQSDQWKEKAHTLYQNYRHGISNPSAIRGTADKTRKTYAKTYNGS